jgi:uncharacterized protein YkwD
MFNFSARKISKSLFISAMAVSMATTSLGIPLTTTAYAATSEDTQQVSNNNGIYGLVALGLLATLIGHGHSSNNNTPAKTTSSNTTVNSSGSSTTTAGSTSSSAGSTSSNASSVTTAEQQAVSLLNADRRANGLADLTVDSRLATVARNHAQDMVTRNFFSHTNPDGQSPFTRITQAGLSYSYAGENIAQDQTVQSAEKALMSDSGHRDNILNKNYTTVGIGVAYNKSGNLYIVQDFIKP